MTDQITVLISSATCEQWVSELSPDLQEDLKREDDPLALAERWASNSTQENLNPFGGTGPGTPYWLALIDQFCKFLCGEEPYAKVVGDLTGSGPVAREVAITTVSAAIATKIGVMWALVSPVVVLLFIAIAKMGIGSVRAVLCKR